MRMFVLGGAVLVALVLAATASAHPRVSPAVSLSKHLQLYSLAVPTEKSGVATTKVVLTVPNGFGIDSFIAALGWRRTIAQTGSGESSVVTKVTWTGGHVPTGEDALFEFLAQPSSNGAYTFGVQQTYSDGSIVNWSGPESSEDPAPTIEAKSSLGGSGSSTLAIVAILVGALAIVLAAIALFAGGGKRELA